MSSAKGERFVVLLTDGEETCGGDPLSILPGTYTVRLEGQTNRAQQVKIEPSRRRR